MKGYGRKWWNVRLTETQTKFTGGKTVEEARRMMGLPLGVKFTKRMGAVSDTHQAG